MRCPAFPQMMANQFPFLSRHPITNYVFSFGVALALLVALGLLIRAVVQPRAHKLPLLGPIVNGISEYEAALRGFAAGKPVVLVAWPNPDVQTVGMLTSTFRDEAGSEHGVVYIPNSPNPLGGIVRVVSMQMVTKTNLAVADVMKLSVSRGTFVKESLKVAAPPEA